MCYNGETRRKNIKNKNKNKSSLFQITIHRTEITFTEYVQDKADKIYLNITALI